MSRSRRSATCTCLSGTQVYHPCFSKVIKFLPFGSPFAYWICILQNKTSREEAKSTSVIGEEGTLTIWRRFEVWSLTKEVPGWSSTCLNLYLVLINEVKRYHDPYTHLRCRQAVLHWDQDQNQDLTRTRSTETIWLGPCEEGEQRPNNNQRVPRLRWDQDQVKSQDPGCSRVLQL